MVKAVDIAILVPEPLWGLAIALSRQINEGDFHLNEVDILPHITLAMGFVEDVEVARKKVEEIVRNFAPIELVAERLEGRYLVIKKVAELEKLHRQITVQTDFVKPNDFSGAYFVKPGEEISEETKEYTANFKLKNSFGNYVPHITLYWDEEIVKPFDFAQGKSAKIKVQNFRLPVKFTVDKISICQLGEKNTCRKVLAKLRLGKSSF